MKSLQTKDISTLKAKRQEKTHHEDIFLKIRTGIFEKVVGGALQMPSWGNNHNWET